MLQKLNENNSNLDEIFKYNKIAKISNSVAKTDASLEKNRHAYH